MNKTFSKRYIILPFELTLDYIVLLDTTRFTYAEDNFIRVTSLGDRRLTAPNITGQLNQCHEKNVSTSTKSCKPLYYPDRKAWGRLSYVVVVVVGASTNSKIKDKLNWNDYHSKLQYHAIPSRMWLAACVLRIYTHSR